MNFRNVIIIICVLMVAILTYQLVDSDKEYKAKIKNLEDDRDRLILLQQKAKDSIYVLNNLYDANKAIIDTLSKKKEQFKPIRNEIPNNVANYPITRIDSTLADYLHPRGN